MPMNIRADMTIGPTRSSERHRVHSHGQSQVNSGFILVNGRKELTKLSRVSFPDHRDASLVDDISISNQGARVRCSNQGSNRLVLT